MNVKVGERIVLASGSIFLTRPEPVTLETSRGRIIIDFSRKTGAGREGDTWVFGADFSGASGPQHSAINGVEMVRFVDTLFGGLLQRLSYMVTVSETAG